MASQGSESRPEGSEGQPGGLKGSSEILRASQGGLRASQMGQPWVGRTDIRTDVRTYRKISPINRTTSTAQKEPVGDSFSLLFQLLLYD